MEFEVDCRTKPLPPQPTNSEGAVSRTKVYFTEIRKASPTCFASFIRHTLSAQQTTLRRLLHYSGPFRTPWPDNAKSVATDADTADWHNVLTTTAIAVRSPKKAAPAASAVSAYTLSVIHATYPKPRPSIFNVPLM